MVPLAAKTVGELLAEIKLSSTALSPHSGLLVVEGEPDSRFFRPRVFGGPEQILIAGGKTNVCRVVKQAYDSGQAGVLGVVDDDCDSLIGVPLPCKHVVRTDERDLEAMLLRSPALEAVIMEVPMSVRMAAVVADEGSVRAALERRALVFGKIRLLNRINGWRVDFRKLNPHRFLQTEWRLDEPLVIREAAHLAGISAHLLRRELGALEAQHPYKLLHGHDTLAVLAEGLRFMGARQCAEEDLAQKLRLAYRVPDGGAAGVLGAVRGWETQNAPFRILRD